MNVRELIKKLVDFDGDVEVMSTYNYDDQSNIMVGGHIAILEEGKVQWSEYHGAYQILDDDDFKGGIFKDVILLK